MHSKYPRRPRLPSRAANRRSYRPRVCSRTRQQNLSRTRQQSRSRTRQQSRSRTRQQNRSRTRPQLRHSVQVRIRGRSGQINVRPSTTYRRKRQNALQAGKAGRRHRRASKNKKNARNKSGVWNHLSRHSGKYATAAAATGAYLFRNRIGEAVVDAVANAGTAIGLKIYNNIFGTQQ